MRYIIKLIILLVVIESEGITQTIPETMIIARDQMKWGNIQLSIMLWKRVAFFSSNDTNIISNIYLGDCHFLLSEYNMALYYYNIANQSLCNDSIYNEIQCRKAMCHMYMHNYNKARGSIDSMIMTGSDYFEMKQKLHKGFITFLGFEFDTSKSELSIIYQNSCPKLKEDLELIYDKTNKINRLKGRKTWILSGFVPGTGQLVQKDYNNALNSAALNASLTGLTIYVGMNYGIPDAALAFLPWWYRYYSGGIKKSKELSMNRVRDLHFNTFFELLELCETCLYNEQVIFGKYGP